jgi:hypothetical protein
MNMELDGDEFQKKYPETFIHLEDDMGICKNCMGKKFYVRTTGYWRYIKTSKGCKHIWRNASGDNVSKFTGLDEVKVV